ncbi:MAG TPA: hypothetical protein VJ850_05330 [Candidatus Limnocylindrales bacterium]|nr:hypothetical protein [Candidatus Limnocylindrales bacterium]
MTFQEPFTGLAGIAGPSALVAAAATVIGAVFLGLFFANGGIWGPLNDVASIVMMLTTVPVVAFFATWTEPVVASGIAFFVAVVGLVGMLGTTLSQGLLLTRIRGYEQLLPWTLGFGAITGFWYVLISITGGMAGMPAGLSALAAISGFAYGALGYGFWRGNERHPLSVVGGIVLLIASTVFLTWLGLSLVAAKAIR